MNYFFRKNNWKEIENHFGLEDPCEMFYQVESIYKSFMCSLTEKQIWIDFLQSNMEQNKTEITMDEVKSLTTKYAFSVVETVLNDLSLTDFEKERKIKGLVRSWEPYRFEKAFYSDYVQFSLLDWKNFMNQFPDWIRRGLNQHRMLQKVKLNQGSKESDFRPSYYHYNSFPFTEIEIKTLENEVVPLTTFFVEEYFNPSSHFEGDIFWLKNEHPRYLYNKQNELLREKKVGTNSFFDCPCNCLSVTLKNKVRSFLYQRTPFTCTFMYPHLNYDGKKSLRYLIEKHFNIIGRISPVYCFSRLHESLLQKLKKQMLHLNKLDSAPKQLLFPEYYFQTDTVRDELDKMWKEVETEFFQEIYHFIIDEPYTVFYSYDPPKGYRNVEKSLTYSIEKVSLFDYITNHKRVAKFIDLDSLFCTEEQKSSQSFPLHEHTTKEIDNYLHNLIH